jgi:hypothetical protein
LGSFKVAHAEESTRSCLQSAPIIVHTHRKLAYWTRETSAQIQDSENIIGVVRIGRSCSRMRPRTSTQSSISYGDRHISR